jgi:hypothetical protein
MGHMRCADQRGIPLAELITAADVNETTLLGPDTLLLVRSPTVCKLDSSVAFTYHPNSCEKTLGFAPQFSWPRPLL